jgi:hypothetical protein
MLSTHFSAEMLFRVAHKPAFPLRSNRIAPAVSTSKVFERSRLMSGCEIGLCCGREHMGAFMIRWLVALMALCLMAGVADAAKRKVIVDQEIGRAHV